MFKTRGGGQGPFKQCWKKLHNWCGMASLSMSFNTNRWSCHRWRYAGNSAKNFLGKIFMSIHCIGGTLLPLYLSWCQITHLPKTETGLQMEQKRHDRNAARAAILEKHPLRKERPFWGVRVEKMKKKFWGCPSQGWAGKAFWLPGTGREIENHIPVLREGNGN